MLRIIFCLLIFIIGGCTTGGKEKEPQLASSYQDNAILIRAVASKDLNEYDHKKHTLKFSVVQVEKLEDVQNQIVTAEGISQLLDADTEADNITQTNKKVHIRTFFIAPGMTQNFTIARMAETKKVLVVAGYYNLTPAGVVRIYEVPVFNKWNPLTFWKKTKQMGRLGIYLEFGSQAINYTESSSRKTVITKTKNRVSLKKYWDK
ncbi:type VI secretion lipoprotein TssJ [Legionella cherrii]|uniref:Type VI secretion lipoprotein n=1 Tax=Legionella cherrii TaxID=28084 RepID=A0A0W0SAX1_9GAMM|nr:type VI secretion lipoprotein TssJ [Legionella cherrii]KTC80627.1 Type VI secretion lipoprotein [Legionella cherrii]VEB34665.1 Type VI secretion lipoprotein [Legionella cherrii]